MTDQINPDHYRHGPVEAIDVIEAAIARAPDPVLANCQGHVLRYILRMWDKGDPAVNAAKAQWYLRRLLGKLEA
jgi:hypothetical protein